MRAFSCSSKTGGLGSVAPGRWAGEAPVLTVQPCGILVDRHGPSMAAGPGATAPRGVRASSAVSTTTERFGAPMTDVPSLPTLNGREGGREKRSVLTWHAPHRCGRGDDPPTADPPGLWPREPGDLKPEPRRPPLKIVRWLLLDRPGGRGRAGCSGRNGSHRRVVPAESPSRSRSTSLRS